MGVRRLGWVTWSLIDWLAVSRSYAQGVQSVQEGMDVGHYSTRLDWRVCAFRGLEGEQVVTPPFHFFSCVCVVQTFSEGTIESGLEGIDVDSSNEWM